LQFSQYLRTCRDHSRLTQEQLVHALYVHDIENFEALDTSILSKWERDVTQPKVAKQVSIVKYFQKQTDKALPCFEGYSIQEAESLICESGMKNILGKSKQLILDFPSAVIGVNDLLVYHVRNSEHVDRYLSINVDLDQDFNHNYSHLTVKQFKTWAVNPANSFYVCEYKGQFFGLLFTLRVKPEIFEKLMQYQIEEEDLKENDFASFDEIGSNYIISFFAMNEKAATLLFIRYYAHLIANQDVIAEVGTSTMMEDGQKLIKKMHFEPCSQKVLSKEWTLQSFRASLSSFLAQESVLKMLLSRQNAPSE